MTNKTMPNNLSVQEYIDSIDNLLRQKDARTILEIMKSVTGETPKMWGSSIVGFGTLHYKYASGREGDTVVMGFSARKAALTLYGVIYYDQNLEASKKLGNVKVGKGCLYIQDLEQIDMKILKGMIEHAYNNRDELFDQKV